MSVGTVMALIQLAIAIQLMMLYRPVERSEHSSWNYWAACGRRVVAGWSFSYLLVGELIFELGF